MNNKVDAWDAYMIGEYLKNRLNDPIEEAPLKKYLRHRIVAALHQNKAKRTGDYHNCLKIGEAITINLEELKRAPNFGRKSFEHWKELRSRYMMGVRFLINN